MTLKRQLFWLYAAQLSDFPAYFNNNNTLRPDVRENTAAC